MAEDEDPKPDPDAPPEGTDPPTPPEPPKPETDWKAEARKWEQRAKTNSSAADRLKELEAASQSDQEKAVTAARAEATNETAARFRDRIITAEIRAAAGGKLADPSDAVRLIDTSQFDLDDNDEVDTKAVTKAVDELLKTKPYLAAKDDRRFQGGADQGPRGGQKTTVAEQITDAESKGDFRLARTLKAQQLTALPHT